MSVCMYVCTHVANMWLELHEQHCSNPSPPQKASLNPKGHVFRFLQARDLGLLSPSSATRADGAIVGHCLQASPTFDDPDAWPYGGLLVRVLCLGLGFL